MDHLSCSWCLNNGSRRSWYRCMHIWGWYISLSNNFKWWIKIQSLLFLQTVESSPSKGKPDLAEADLVIFCGDFNYRLFGISYDDARDLVSQRSFDWLRERDQLRAEMKAGKVFQGMREAIVRFPPTYKFAIGKPGLGGKVLYFYLYMIYFICFLLSCMKYLRTWQYRAILILILFTFLLKNASYL